MRKQAILILSGLVILALIVAGCGGGAQKLQNINIATATTGGVYYPLGNAMAQIFSKNIPNVKASAQATAGTPQNVLLMQKKEAEIAFAQNGVTYYAYNGKGMFNGKPVKNLRGISHLYPNVMHIVVRADSDIKSIKDLKDKRFVPGAVGSATEINSKEILGLYGLDYKDKKNVKADYLGYSEAAEALKDGRVDGILIAGGLPTAAVLDAASSVKIRILSLEPDMLAKLTKEMPWYYEIKIPKGTYIGQTEDVTTVAVANILICRDDLSTDLVYNITKTLYEKHSDLVAAHSAAKAMKLEMATKGMTVPLHPGAEKYYKEKGIIK
ncbi:TAXI family TRAP transporter solute-binding subunit [Anaeroselena agilis]|uniref:TAXI family TRAP transporter solute-binding subunit n=1 Tax=Anaeroselena agilis TaxID=3063788 RepID=A0ABU3P3X2_9FIRM|nr:TAXI family TRAP transporter solute-binding subunit [Selenomonadales bacterium 4137-cl]